MADLVARIISREAYAGFLEKAVHSAFHRIEWLQIASAIFHLQLITLGYFSGKQLVAVTPLQGRKIGPFCLWGAPLRKSGTPAATPLCSPSKYSMEAAKALHVWRRDHNLKYVQVTLPGRVDAGDIRFDRQEFSDNLELDLTQPLSVLWSALDQQKSCVRAALRNGVKIHWRHALELLTAQERLLHDTYVRQGAPPNYPLELYALLLNKKKEAGIRILCATHKNEVLAITWILSDLERCYYWDAASMDEGKKLKANHLLVWSLICWAKSRGLKTLDFAGTATGGHGGSRPGIGRFKQSMGAKPQSYSILYWYSPFMGVALDGYRFIQSIKRNLHKRPTANESIRP